MRRLRITSTRRLLTILAFTGVLAATAAIAQAALTAAGAVPPPKALAQAILDAIDAPDPEGVTARITFTNNLLPGGSLPQGTASPLLAGAKGRLWLSNDGRLRLELQSAAGDAQITADEERVTVVDLSSNTVYRAKLPAESEDAKKKADRRHPTPTVARIQRALDRVARFWTVSGAQPTSTADQPSYTVKVSPKDDGGLLGAAELAWDAATGVPLRAAVYAQGQSDPVLELAATEITYGAVADADLSASSPAGAEVIDISPKAADKARRGSHSKRDHVEGLSAVRAQLDFPLAAPDKLAGLPRQEVHLIDVDGEQAALVTYGEGFGAIAVLQHKAKPEPEDEKKRGRGGSESPLNLPEINIDGATGTEIATALGTVVTFERDGISYVVAGSVPPLAAENAARGLR